MDPLLAWVSSWWPEVDWSGADVRRGAFHDVVIALSGELARTTTRRLHAERTAAEVAVLDVVARVDLPLPTPLPIGSVAGDAARSGVLLRSAPGVAEPDRPWSHALAVIYRALLIAFAAVPPSTRRDLPTPRSWCGGERWPALVAEVTGPLPPAVRGRAAEVVTDVLAAEREAPNPSFVHGDFGPHNLLWRDGTASGLIDLDHAAFGDPAIDIAPLIGFHGTANLAAIVDADTLARARLHRAGLPLQVACAARLCGNAPLRNHALGNFDSRVRAGTLYDPAGSGRG